MSIYVCACVYSNIGMSTHLCIYTDTSMHIQTTWSYIFPNLDQDNTESLSDKIKAISKVPFTPHAPFLYYSGTATVISVHAWALFGESCLSSTHCKILLTESCI